MPQFPVSQFPGSTAPEPLVLLPGLLCDGALWRAQLQALQAHAPFVADLTQDDSIPAMAQRALDACPPHFALAGLSMGGYVALEMVRTAPQRIRGLALLGSSARPNSPEAAARRRGLIALAQRGRFRGVTSRLLPTLVHSDRLQDDELTTTVMAMTARIGADSYQRQQTAVLERRDARADLAHITCPTLVLCGRQDAVTPLEHSLELAAMIAGSALVILEECGHLTSLERPEAVTQAMIQWLGRL